jgi:hypothetical protein
MYISNESEVFHRNTTLKAEQVHGEDTATRIATLLIKKGCLVIVEPIGERNFVIYVRDDIPDSLFIDIIQETQEPR